MTVTVLAATWGIGWALLVVFLLLLFVTYVVVQGTRAQMEWRRQVQRGNLDVIQTLVTEEVERWKRDRPPKGVPANVWRGVQGVELMEIGVDYVRATTTAEAQFQMVDGRRREVSSALDEAMKVTVQLADMFLYDIPHVRPDRVQIDVYTTFRTDTGETRQECILSTVVRRQDVIDLDWEAPPHEIIRAMGGRYQLDMAGHALPITPDTESVRNGRGPMPPRELQQA